MINKERKVAVLFSRLSGYMGACLKTLKNKYNIELLVIKMPPSDNAPFNENYFNWIDHLYDRTRLSVKDITSLLKDFAPDAIFMSGWHDSDYLKVARQMRKKGVVVVAGSDTQWKGSFRQYIGKIIAPWYLHSAIDILWGAGERQKKLAEKIGFHGEDFWSGVYACDWDKFDEAYSQSPNNEQPYFLFVGRYIRKKGIDLLVDAYRQYREKVPNPWPLICVGSGELESLLEGQPGIVNKGFMQPDELPGIMSAAGAFVLPSRYEPWGVVIQEATVVGLPILCSDACGASVHLVQDGYNGYIMENENSLHLMKSMIKISTMDKKKLDKMNQGSRALSGMYTPERWADTFIDGINGITYE